VILPLAFACALHSVVEPVPPPAVTDFLAQPDRAWERDLPRIVADESGGTDVPNWRYDPRHTAGGYLQITDSNWHRYAPKLGIDVRRYPTAMSSPCPDQMAVGKLMHRMYGLAPWDRTHGGSQPVTGVRYAQRVMRSSLHGPMLSSVSHLTSVPPAKSHPEHWRVFGEASSIARAEQWIVFP
jgi:hypothetical protein